MDQAILQCTWLGHSAFLLEHHGFTVAIDPWFGNPKFPADKKIEKVDAILISHGHFDHVGDAVQLAKDHKCKVFCIFEISKFLAKQGVPEDQIVGLNKGGTVDLGGAGFRATMVNAIHSGCCGMADLEVGGDPAGWVIHTHGGHVIYHAGDTDVFGDMQIIDDMHRPDVALLPIGGHYTMGPQGAAYALDKFLHNTKIVVPMHYGTFPALAGTPAELQQLLQRKDVIVSRLEPGEALKLGGRSVKDLF